MSYSNIKKNIPLEFSKMLHQLCMKNNRMASDFYKITFSTNKWWSNERKDDQWTLPVSKPSFAFKNSEHIVPESFVCLFV